MSISSIDDSPAFWGCVTWGEASSMIGPLGAWEVYRSPVKPRPSGPGMKGEWFEVVICLTSSSLRAARGRTAPPGCACA